LTGFSIGFIIIYRWVIFVQNEQEFFERRMLLDKLYDKYKPLLTEKQREVYELHEFSDLSLGEIAEQKEKSRQAIHDLLIRTKNKLEILEKKMGLVTREEIDNV
jgi:predicted DNA-binding protein YlxM (UPF0122 family)